MGDCLRRSLDRAQAADAILRVRLHLSSCSDLADLPWELLYDKRDDWFLALSDRTPIVRYIQLPAESRALKVDLPLRVLVIRSEPVDKKPLDLDSEWTAISASLSGLTARGLIKFTELQRPTLSELRRVLMRDRFHVLHYMGHGGFGEQDGGVLLFTDEAGRSAPVTAENLGVMLRDHASLRLALLNACEGGRSDPADPFAGIADTLVRRGVPAVIAMQFEISDDAAIAFAPAIYEALATGRPIDQATAEARKAIYSVSPLEWATPVLYLRTDDSVLFDITDSAHASGAAAHTDAGDHLCAQSRYTDAVTSYQNALAIDMGLARAHTGLGGALYHLKRFPEAESASREAVRLDPGSAVAHNNLGNALHGQGRYPEAAAHLREAIKLDPDYGTAYSRLGEVLSVLERYSEAAFAYEHAVRLDPANGAKHASLGLAQLRDGQLAKAEQSFQKAVKYAPLEASAYAYHGQILQRMGCLVEAEYEFKKAIVLAPGDGQVLFSLGELLCDQGRYAEAEVPLQEAIHRDRNHADWHFRLAVSYFARQRFVESELALRDVIRLSPSEARAHFIHAMALYHLGRLHEAALAYRRAAMLDPYHPSIARLKYIEQADLEVPQFRPTPSVITPRYSPRVQTADPVYLQQPQLSTPAIDWKQNARRQIGSGTPIYNDSDNQSLRHGRAGARQRSVPPGRAPRTFDEGRLRPSALEEPRLDPSALEEPRLDPSALEEPRLDL
jgi:tetratricopeptide (TPR) repeat protein